jgi:hypothetical protein
MEMWDEPRSSCHYFHGTPAIWLYEGLVGLRRSAEGWQHFTVTPQLDTDVSRARISRGTRRGRVVVDWDRDRGHHRGPGAGRVDRDAPTAPAEPAADCGHDVRRLV